MKLVVMIPAYNEEKSIGAVIEEIPRSIEGIDLVEILVINDGSIDMTVEKALLKGATKIISNKKNLGLAKSFKIGMNEAMAMGADIIVNIDADGQYDASEIRDLIEPIIKNKADMVLGNRQVKTLKHMPHSKKIGNIVATFITSKLAGYPIYDAQTGYRAFSKDAAMKLNILSEYTYVQETIIQATHKDFTIYQIPIKFRKRDGDSKLISNIFSYAKKASVSLIKTYRDYNPLKAYGGLGVIFSMIGFGFGFIVLNNYFNTGSFSGHIGRGLLSVMFLFIGLQMIIFGLIADILKNQRILQEEILYTLKKRK